MLKKTYPIWLLGLMVVFLAFACSDDDEETPTGTNNQQTMDHIPTLDSIQVPAAMAASSDPYAQMAVTYVNMTNGLANLGQYFVPPSKAAKSAAYAGSEADTLIWSWSYGGITVYLKFWETLTHYYWRYMWHGTYDQVVYDNWIWYAANQTKDGTAGQLVWYDDNSLIPFLTWEWTYLAGVYTLTYTFDNINQLIITVNADGSGSLEYYEDSVLKLRIIWYANGSGAWWTYGPDSNGTWLVGKN